MTVAAALQPDTRLSRAADVCALIAAGIGALVIAGWMLEIEPLKRLHPDFVAMKFNTALGFVVAGAALWWRGRPALRLGLGVLVALLGAASLGEHAWGRDFGIDQLFVREVRAWPEERFAPGRMAPATAMGLLLCGLALLCQRSHTGSTPPTRASRWCGYIAEVLALGAAATAGATLVGYVAGVEYLRHLPGFISMAVHTAAALLLLAVAILCAAPEGMVAYALRARGTARTLWLGFGVLTVLLAALATVTALRLQSIADDVDALANVAQARGLTTRELEINVLDYALGVRAALAGDAEAGRAAADNAANVERHLADYQAMAQTERQRELGAQFAAQWRELYTLNEAVLKAGRQPSPQESAGLAAVRGRLEKFLDEQMQPDAAAAYDFHKDGTVRDLQITEVLNLILLVVGLLIALVTSGMVARGVSGHVLALQEAEAAVRSIAQFPDENPHPVSRIDQGGIVLYANSASAALSPQWRCHAGQPAPEMLARLARETLQAGQGRETDLTSEGKVFSFIFTPVANGGYVNLYGREITERKRAEEVLRESESFFRQTLESIPGMVFTTGPDGYCDYQSQQWVDFTGVPMSDHVGDGWNKLLHPDDRPRAFAAWRDAVEERAPYDVEYRVRRYDGEYEWFKVRGRAIRDAAGRIVRWFGVATSIEALKRAEEALRRAAAFDEAAMKSLGEGLYTTDEKGLVTSMNPAAEELFGWTFAELRGKKMHDMTHHHYRDGRPFPSSECAGFQVLMTGRPLKNHEDVFIRKDGTFFDVIYSIAPMRDAAGKITSLVVVFADITERKQAEEQLERFFAVSPDLMCMIGFDGYFKRINASFERVLGFSQEELLSRPFLEFVHSEDRPATAAASQRLAEGRAVRKFENRYCCKDGSIRWIEWHCAPLMDRQVVYCVARDITERRRAEEGLRESEERLRLAVQTADLGLFDGNMRTGEVYMSAQLKAQLGYRDDELRNTFEEFDIRLHPEDRERIVQGIRENVAHPHPDYKVEFRLRHRDGSYRTIFSRAVVAPDQTGALCRMVGTHLDITERKHAEESIQVARLNAEHAKAEAELASKAKDHFLAVLSHELRTPLTPVVATLGMLQDDPRFDADTRESLEMIRRNVEVEARLIDDLLDVTRIERGKLELERQPVKLCAIIRRAVEVCMPDIEARKLEFGIDAAGGPYVVNADAARLQQVIWNLLKNAIKFTPKGGCVGIRCRRVDDHVVAEINDSGEGIAPEVLPRLFNAFEQGDRNVTRQFGGLGLGLAISKAITELHGGSLSAHSEGKGKGATFAIRLPVLPVGAGASATPSDSGTALAIATTRPLRILLVEDHGDTARVMQRLLSSSGHEVQLAADVATALKLADEQPFDLLLSDLGLPDGSGLDLLRAIRAKGLNLPGIALSGYGQEQDMQQSHEAGFAAHLVKPVRLPRLEEAIAKLFEHSETM